MSVGVLFELRMGETLPGETLCVVGSRQELGSWEARAVAESSALRLSTSALVYPRWLSRGPIWLDVGAPEVAGKSCTFEFKFVKVSAAKDPGGNVQWEEGVTNRLVNLPCEDGSIWIVSANKWDAASEGVRVIRAFSDELKAWHMALDRQWSPHADDFDDQKATGSPNGASGVAASGFASYGQPLNPGGAGAAGHHESFELESEATEYGGGFGAGGLGGAVGTATQKWRRGGGNIEDQYRALAPECTLPLLGFWAQRMDRPALPSSLASVAASAAAAAAAGVASPSGAAPLAAGHRRAEAPPPGTRQVGRSPPRPSSFAAPGRNNLIFSPMARRRGGASAKSSSPSAAPRRSMRAGTSPIPETRHNRSNSTTGGQRPRRSQLAPAGNSRSSLGTNDVRGREVNALRQENIALRDQIEQLRIAVAGVAASVSANGANGGANGAGDVNAAPIATVVSNGGNAAPIATVVSSGGNAAPIATVVSSGGNSANFSDSGGGIPPVANSSCTPTIATGAAISQSGPAAIASPVGATAAVSPVGATGAISARSPVGSPASSVNGGVFLAGSRSATASPSHLLQAAQPRFFIRPHVKSPQGSVPQVLAQPRSRVVAKAGAAVDPRLQAAVPRVGGSIVSNAAPDSSGPESGEEADTDSCGDTEAEGTTFIQEL